MLQKKWLMAALFVYGLFGETDRLAAFDCSRSAFSNSTLINAYFRWQFLNLSVYLQ
jgi:hypothetical protein